MKPQTKKKLNKILEIFRPAATAVDFAEFDLSIGKLKEGLKQKIQTQALDDVNRQLEKFRRGLNVDSILEAAGNLETTLNQQIEGISGRLSTELGEFQKLLTNQGENAQNEISNAASNIEQIRQELEDLKAQKNADVSGIKDKIGKLLDFTLQAQDTFINLEKNINEIKGDKTTEKLGQRIDNEVRTISEAVEGVKKDFDNKLKSIHIPGHANRNIAIGGNTSVLSRYTDINIKAGSNVTLTYANNNVTKYLDLTIGSSGGGGSVGGVVRSINRVDTSQTMGADGGTDYVYIATEGIRLELPTAVGNTNLYTIKNVSASSVLVATTGAETIDNDTNLILATQFTAVDLVNDGADDWGIT